MSRDSTRATLWVIVASATLTVMAGAVLGPVVPDIRDGLGVSESLAGLVITMHGAVIVIFSPLAGELIDRYGPRRPSVAMAGYVGQFVSPIVFGALVGPFGTRGPFAAAAVAATVGAAAFAAIALAHRDR